MGVETYEAFVQVVEQGSVSAAARVLGVPRPTVSRRLARLEEELGERLVRRGARTVTVTRVGRALYQRIRSPMDALLAAERELKDRGDRPAGTLRVAVPPLLAVPLAPLFADFQAACPDVSLELLTETRFVELTAEGFDVALRAGTLTDADLVQRKLLTTRAGLFASPDYLARRGTPTEPSDLAAHTLLLGTTPQDEAQVWWPTRSGRLRVSGTFATNDRALLRAACAAGQGIALLVEVPPLPDGLQPLLPEVGADLPLYVVYPERDLLPARSRAFIDATVAFFARWDPTR